MSFELKLKLPKKNLKNTKPRRRRRRRRRREKKKGRKRRNMEVVMRVRFVNIGLHMPVIVFLFVSMIRIGCAAATTHSRSGFLYTRTRGRCTPQYWSSGREEWPRMVPQRSTVSKVFGSRAFERYRSALTLLESTSSKDDQNAFGLLLKQASAALLNSYARKGFPYTAWQVKTLVIQALVSKEAAATQAKRFSLANDSCN